MSSPTTDQPGAARPTSIRRVTVATALGTMIEWYDFFLYGTAAALIFPSVFFPSDDPSTGTLLSFATFATGFAARPVGGAIFGHLGDRVGRRTVLVITLLTMGLATMAVGLLPGYAQIGIAAPILLVVLRVAQGMGTGGEWGGAALMSRETGSRRPGFWGSFIWAAVFAGLVLGSLVFVALAAILTEEQLLSWGWRLPFLLSIVLVAIGLWIRRNLPESPEFTALKRQEGRVRAPLLEALRQPRNVLAIFLMRMGQNTTFNIVSVFVLTYATTTLGLDRSKILLATVVGAVVALLLCPVYGALGDRFGFRRVMTVALLVQALFAFPFFLLIDTGEQGMIILAVTLGIAGGAAAADAIQPAFFPAMFGTGIRMSAVSIGREGGTVVGGGLAPLIATGLLALAGGEPWAIAAYMVFTSLIGVLGVRLARPEPDLVAETDRPADSSRTPSSPSSPSTAGTAG